MSARAISSVCPGRPYIRSRLTLSKAASAASIARRASSARVDAAERASACASSKLCTPIEMRFTPASRKPRKRAASTVPGFASSVISASGLERQARAHAGEQRVDRFRREQARRAAADEHAGQPPAPDRGQQRFEVEQQLLDVCLLRQLARALVRIEVAIRALAHAPRDVHVERERRQRLQPDAVRRARSPRLSFSNASSLAARCPGG